MNREREQKLDAAIRSNTPLDEIVDLLRQYKDQGVTQAEVYAFLESLHEESLDEEVDDRVLEVADFVAGFCSAHESLG